MKMIRLFGFLLAASGALTSSGQTDCDGERYRYNSAYDEVQVTYSQPYGSNVDAFGLETTLEFDFYEGVGNSDEQRPLLIVAHGGFFLGGSNDGEDVVPMCEDFAKMGYAVASISYRIGIVNFLDVENELVKAVWRGVHDSRAAVRYFRKSVAEDGNPWGIDTERMFLGGVSAGGFIALHHAYVDEDSEIPTNIDQTQAGLQGGIEGESGNPGYASTVSGIFNVCGAIKDADWMAAGDVPVVSVHGTDDGTVPYGFGQVMLSGFPVTDVDGSSVVHEKAEELGILNCFVPIEGAGHVPHVTNAAAYDLTLSTVAGALSSWLCASYANQCGEYDYTSEVEVLEADRVMLFPNPCNGYFQLRNEAAHAGTWLLKVRDMQGRLVLQSQHTGSAAEFNVAGLPSGVYVVDVEDWHWHQQLLVQ